ncbi:MAG: M23 family metallopeptidase [Parcubacteria group bacterium]|nr:M23 family metallopeptidase [Parcubacteria group bacterium]
MVSQRVLLVCLVILGLWRSPPVSMGQAHKDLYTFKLFPGSVVYQGQTLKIEFEGSYTIKPEIKYQGKDIPSFQYQDKIVALIPIDSQEVRGVKLISVNNFDFLIPILVRENNFSTTRLRPFSPSTSPEFLAEKQKLRELFNDTSGNVYIDGEFQNPLENKIVVRSQFGTKRVGKIQTGIKTLRTKTRKGRTRTKNIPVYSSHTHIHKGIDLYTIQGKKTKVFSVNNGEVMIAEPFMAEGNFIVIRYAPGVFSLYMHLSAINVKPGQIVFKGQLLGLAGNTGNVYGKRRIIRLKNSKKRVVITSGGVHLHFEIKVNGVSVDPIQFMQLFN